MGWFNSISLFLALLLASIPVNLDPAACANSTDSNCTIAENFSANAALETALENTTNDTVPLLAEPVNSLENTGNGAIPLLVDPASSVPQQENSSDNSSLMEIITVDDPDSLLENATGLNSANESLPAQDAAGIAAANASGNAFPSPEILEVISVDTENSVLAISTGSSSIEITAEAFASLSESSEAFGQVAALIESDKAVAIITGQDENNLTTSVIAAIDKGDAGLISEIMEGGNAPEAISRLAEGEGANVAISDITAAQESGVAGHGSEESGSSAQASEASGQAGSASATGGQQPEESGASAQTSGANGRTTSGQQSEESAPSADAGSPVSVTGETSAEITVLAATTQNGSEGEAPVRIIATSGAPLDLGGNLPEEGVSLLPSGMLPEGMAVVEIGKGSFGSIAALAEQGVEKLYLDTPMSALLTETIPLIGADRAQSQLNLTGEGVTVCLLDTGVDFSLASLGGKAVTGYDFVNGDSDATDDNPQQHGTKMASIIHSVAPNATILSVKVLNENGTGYSSTIIAGIDYCRQLAAGGSVKIISMSFGGGSFDGYCDEVSLVAQSVNDAVSSSLLAIAAAGNNLPAGTIAAPACAQNATAVGSTDKSDAVSSFSTLTPMVDLLAPGEGVIVNGATLPPGTSLSAAHVSGAAALLLASNSSLAPADAEWRFRTTGKPIEFSGANYTRIDAYNAITNNFTSEPARQPAGQTNNAGSETFSAAFSSTQSPGTLSNVPYGSYAWSSPSSAATSNNIYANASPALDYGAITDGLQATNFNFSIPGTAAINGVVVDVERRRSPNSFPAGTLLRTPSGLREISTLRKGDVLLSFDGFNIAIAAITSIPNHTVNETVFLRSHHSNVTTTAEHPFFNGLNFTLAKDLQVGSGIYRYSGGRLVEDTIIEKKTSRNSILVFTPSVSTPNTYFANDFAVHNKGIAEVVDSSLLLVVGGTAGGNNHADNATSWPFASDGTASYGNSSDVWGWSLTPSNVNASNFGVVLYAQSPVTNGAYTWAAVDAVTITVYWSPAGNTNDCSNLSTAGFSYTLNRSVSNATNCFTINAPGVSLDCQGYNVSGGTGYAIASNSTNTTIKNCVLYNSSDAAIRLNNGAHNANITNVNASNVSNGVYLTSTVDAAQNITVADSSFSVSSNSSSNASLWTQSRGGRYTNAVFNTSSNASNSYGAVLNGGAQNNQFINVTFGSGIQRVAQLDSAAGTNNNNNFTNCTVAEYTGGSSGFFINADSNNIVIDGCNVTTLSGSGIGFTGSTPDNVTMRNTIISTATGAGISVGVASAGISVNNVNYSGGGQGLAISSTATNGVYSNMKINTTSGSAAIAISAASTGNIFTNVTTISSIGVAMSSASATGNVFNRLNVSATSDAVTLNAGAGVTIANSTIATTNSVDKSALYINGATSTNNLIINTSFSSAAHGIYLSNAPNNNFTNVTVNSTGGGSTNAITFAGTSSGNIFNRSFLISNSTDVLDIVSNNNQLINNTLMSTSGILARLSSTASSNIFYWNNFSTTSDSYVSDTASGTNYYNSTEGNIWQDVANQTLTMMGTTASSGFPSLYIGTTGDYPYNNSTSSKILGNVVDYKPLTPFNTLCRSLSTAGSTFTLITNSSISGATCFNIVAANVTLDCNGYTITGSNTTNRFGVYSNATNTTVKNCIFQAWQTAIYLNSSANNSLATNNTIRNALGTTGNPGATVYGIHLAASSSQVNNTTITSLTGGAGSSGATARSGGNIFGIYVSGTNNTLSRVMLSSLAAGTGGTATSGGDGAAAGSAYGIYLNSTSNNLTNINATSISGGTGGTSSGGGAIGGNGGAGGESHGYYLSSASGSSLSNTNATAIIGGTGGAGDSGTLDGGNGGNGGIASAFYFSSSSTSSLSASSTANVTAGAGGAGGAGENVPGTGGNGGAAFSAYLSSSSTNNIANNTFNLTNGGEGGMSNGGTGGNGGNAYTMFAAGSFTNNIINNTLGSLVAGTGGAAPGGTPGVAGINNSVFLNSASGSNTFYWNNFTATSGYYVNDTNGSNYYNTSVSGNPQGNRWANILNGSLHYVASAQRATWLSGYYYADSGWNYPYNNSSANSGGRIAGNVVDHAPFTNLTNLCGVLSSTGATYAMNANASINGANCFNITAANITLNCNGYTITGNNTTSTYGIYSTQANTTVKNCIISNFTNGASLSGSSCTIQNVTATTTKNFGIGLQTGSSCTINGSTGNATVGTGISAGAGNSLYNSNGITASGTGLMPSSASTLSNVNGTATSGIGVELSASVSGIRGTATSGTGIRLSGLSSVTVSNSAGTATSGTGIEIVDDTSSILINATGSAGTGSGIVLDGGTGTKLINSTGSSDSGHGISSTDLSGGFPANANLSNTPGSSNSSSAVFLAGGSSILFDCQGLSMAGKNASGSYGIYSAAFNTTVKNCIISNFTNAIYLNNSASGSVINNTLSPDMANSNTLLVATGSSSGNTFYWNNFTATSGYYVNDTNGSNYYNTSVSGNPQGNRWANILNGSLHYVASAQRATWLSGYYYADSGWNYPYNNSAANSGGKIVGNVADYAPFTNLTTLCGALNSAGTTYTMNANAGISGATCFTVTAANVTLECAGYRITGNNAASTYGAYSAVNNTTIKNCIISNFTTAIYFNTSHSGLIQNNTANSTQSSGRGVYLSNSTSNNLINNTAFSSSSQAIALVSGSTLNNLTGNTGTSTTGQGIYVAARFNRLVSNTGISSEVEGISIDGPPSGPTGYNTLINNTANSTSGNALYIWSSYNNITSLQATSNSGAAFMLDGTGGANNAAFNTLSNITATSTSGYGIYLSSSENNTIANSTATSSSAIAFYIASSTGNTIINVSGSSSSDGISLSSSSNNNITNSTGTTGANSGISVLGGTGNILSNIRGIATSSGIGILLSSTSSNSIINSFANSSSGQAIRLTSSTYNNITNTTAITGTGYGVRLFSSSNFNRLENNTVNATGSGGIGIDLSASSNNTLNSNNATSTTGDAIKLESSSNGNNLTNDVGNSSSGYGIIVTASTGNRLDGGHGFSSSGNGMTFASAANNNNATNSRGTSWGAGAGFYIITSYNITATNITATSVSGNAVLLAGFAGHALTNISATSTSGEGFGAQSTSNSLFANVTASSSSGYGASILGGSNITFANSTITSGSNISLRFSSSAANSTIINTTINSTSGIALLLESNSTNNSIYLSRLSSNSSAALSINSGHNSSIYNNTFSSTGGASTLLLLSGASANNTFYWNNFTNTSGPYVNDSSSGNNSLNTSVNGIAQGNYWFNVYTTNEVRVYDDNLDGWADTARAGYSYPYGENTSGGKIVGAVADYGPAIIPYRITYLVNAYWNRTPTIYFANNTTANITANGTFSSTPKITIIDSGGTTRVDNATMNGSSSPYYYIYQLNGSNGYYNTTISDNGTAPQSFPVLFYGMKPWNGNFTDYNGTLFAYRRLLNVSEPNTVARARQPVDVFLNLTSTGGNNSIRIALLQNGSLIEIPHQLYNISYNNSSGKMTGANVVFIDSFLQGQNKTYYLHYTAATRTSATYGSDLSFSNQSGNYTFANSHFSANATKTRGGTITGLKSKYSDLEFAGATVPMASPEIRIATLSFRAYNATSPADSQTNGSVFAKYNSRGSYIFLNYTMNYTFYAGTNYFIVETNVSTPLFGGGLPTTYRDANFSLAKARFYNTTYQNNASTTQQLSQSGAGSTYANLTAITKLQFDYPTIRNQLAYLLVQNTSTATLNPLLTIADTAGNYQFSRQLFNGTANSSTWFYSKVAYMISDTLDASLVNSTYLALTNPTTYAFATEEVITASPPSYTTANYTPQPANDTANVTCFTYWQSSLSELTLFTANITFISSNFSASVLQDLTANESWVNYTANSSVLEAGAASCNITVTDSFGNSNSTLISFTVADLTAPAFSSINNSPSTNASLDPNVTITVTANITEFSNISAAVLQYNSSSSNSSLTNVSMSLSSNGTGWRYYSANFTPAAEANYSYRIFANDSSGNSATSNSTNLAVFYDWTWSNSPSTFGSVGTTLNTNATISTITINNTGDNSLSFTISSNFYDKNKIYYNSTAEGSSGYTVSVAANSSSNFTAVGTGRTSASSDSLTITIAALNSSASPSSATVTGTFISCAGGPCLSIAFDTAPSSVTQGDTGVNLSGHVTNVGNESSTGTNFSWSLPSGWSITSGSANSSLGTLLSSEQASSSIVASVSSNASTGSQSVTISTINNQNNSASATTTVVVLSSGGSGGSVSTGTSTGGGPSGGGGGGGGEKTNDTIVLPPPPKKVEKPLTLQQKEQLFSTLATYELVRGRDNTFTLTITNPLEDSMQNVSVDVSGYLYQYLSISPSLIDAIPSGESREVKITIAAPKYFTEGAFTLYFDIKGKSVSQTEDSLITTNVHETRTVELKVLEMSREEALSTMREAVKIRNEMQENGIYQGPAKTVFEDMNSSYSQDKFSALKPSLSKLRDLKSAALAAKQGLSVLKEKLDRAASEDIKAPNAMRLYSLANAAFERGDYQGAAQRLGDAELTYALETAQGFSIYSFFKAYAIQILAGLAMLGLITTIVFVDIRFWMLENELSQLSKEEDIVLGLLKQVQIDYFSQNKLSTEEYSSTVDNYEGRLSKIVQRRIEVETLRKNYFSFKGRAAKMAQEKARLEELIAALQRDYLENGRVETHIYENRMKSYVSRLSEIEEQMAVAEAERSLRAGKKILAAEAKGQQSEIAAIPKPAESVQKAPRKEQAPTAIQKEKLEPLSEQAPPAIQKPAKPTTDSKQQGSPQKSASLNGKEKPSGASKGKNK